MPALSVILPAHNAGDTLQEAVESVLGQTFGDFEVVLVDDGSDDDTRSVAAFLAARDSRVRPVFSPRVGLVAALNLGFSLSRGELIARMDADDRCHPERFRLQERFLAGRPDVALVGCRIESFSRDCLGEGFRIYTDWLNALTEPEEIAREIFIESPLCHPSVMMRRGDLKAMGGYQDHGWAEDYDLWLRLHLAGKRFAKVPEVLFSWREHPGRLTRTDGRYSIENFLRAKAHYLATGPLAKTGSTLLWGAGQTGRRLSKHLQREGVRVISCIDIDPAKIGGSLRGTPIFGPEDLPTQHAAQGRPMILSAVSSRGARGLIRRHLTGLGFTEGVDFLCAA